MTDTKDKRWKRERPNNSRIGRGMGRTVGRRELMPEPELTDDELLAEALAEAEAWQRELERERKRR